MVAKSCSTMDDWNPINHVINHQWTGAVHDLRIQPWTFLAIEKVAVPLLELHQFCAVVLFLCWIFLDNSPYVYDKYTYLYTHTIRTHTHTCIYIYIYILIYLCIYLFIYIFNFLYIYVYKYTPFENHINPKHFPYVIIFNWYVTLVILIFPNSMWSGMEATSINNLVGHFTKSLISDHGGRNTHHRIWSRDEFRVGFIGEIVVPATISRCR